MDVYRYYAENETSRLILYFTYEVHAKELIPRIENALEGKIHIYDIFPEPHSEKVVLTEPLSVITISGQEMFLPPGFEVTFFDRVRVLFGDKED